MLTAHNKSDSISDGRGACSSRNHLEGICPVSLVKVTQAGEFNDVSKTTAKPNHRRNASLMDKRTKPRASSLRLVFRVAWRGPDSNPRPASYVEFRWQPWASSGIRRQTELLGVTAQAEGQVKSSRPGSLGRLAMTIRDTTCQRSRTELVTGKGQAP